jgi:hypothetical protein
MPAKTIGIVCQDDIGAQADQFLRGRSYPIDLIAGPTQARKRLSERGDASLPHEIVFVGHREQDDSPHAVARLRARRDEGRGLPVAMQTVVA